MSSLQAFPQYLCVPHVQYINVYSASLLWAPLLGCLSGLSSLGSRSVAICQDIQAPALDVRIRGKKQTEKTWKIKKKKQTRKNEMREMRGQNSRIT